LEKLVEHWLRLNVDNPELFNTHISMTRSPAIIEATSAWMRAGGRTSEHLSRSIQGSIRAGSRYQRSILPGVLRFARAWLKANPEDEDSGIIYADVLWATRKKLDIDRAKQWYGQHQSSKKACFIIANILELSYWDGAKADLYALNEAKLLLSEKSAREKMPRLVGALVGVQPDENSVAWAKELYARHHLLWILMRLLMRAPDADTIAKAELAYDRWKDHAELEPEMIYALLCADPKNKLALRRAKLWLKRSPTNKWIKATKIGIGSAS